MQQLEIYDKMLIFKQELIDTLGVEQDGWVAEDRWEEVKEARENIYEMSIREIEDEKDREDMKVMWPFDGVKRPGSQAARIET
ncbi:hypothetical protein MaudCBS49596_003128 [Microsporum audouinii]